MNEPWFSEWIWLCYLPIRWQGWIVLALMCLTVFPFGWLFVTTVSSWPTFGWCFALIAAAVAGNIVIQWKLECDYSR